MAGTCCAQLIPLQCLSGMHLVKHAHADAGCFNPRAVMGATERPRSHTKRVCRFNPRARDGRDPRIPQEAFGLRVFQPTRP